MLTGYLCLLNTFVYTYIRKCFGNIFAPFIKMPILPVSGIRGLNGDRQCGIQRSYAEYSDLLRCYPIYVVVWYDYYSAYFYICKYKNAQS